jgi:ribonucleotide reductase alpha subunit
LTKEKIVSLANNKLIQNTRTSESIMLTKIIKRTGLVEEFIPHKLNKWGLWAADQLGDRVDWSGVVLDAVSSVLHKDGVAKSQDLQNALIAQCLSRKDYPHNLMAGRLLAATTRKELYDEFTPSVRALQSKLYKLGLMKKMDYSDEDYRTIESYIDHERDFKMTHFQIEYTAIKYGLKNQKTKERYETPQFIYMRLAMHLAEKERGSKRLSIVKDLYEEFNSFRINPPTPALNNLGTLDTGLASCCLYKTGDSIESLHAGDSIAYLMTAASAGIGGIMSTRSVGDPVRNGKIAHKGKLPYLTAVAGAVKANTQGSRGGAITCYVPITDPEIEMILMLQNVRTPADKQNRDVHIAIQGNKFITQKALNREKMFLFNSFTAPDLYESFFSKDTELFGKLYDKYEKDDHFKKTYVDAYDLVYKAQTQSIEVGTLYAAFMDEINRHTPHLDPIYSSNLCVTPGTKILTDKGYHAIGDLKDQEVNVWNGEEWSNVTVRMTSEASHIVRVMTDVGHWLDCTTQHKFYVKTEEGAKELPAVQLRKGMELIDYDLPRYVETENATEFKYLPVLPLFSLPNAHHTLKSRLDWLRSVISAYGYIDMQDKPRLIIRTPTRSSQELLMLALQLMGANTIGTYDEIDERYAVKIPGRFMQALIDLGLEHPTLNLKDCCEPDDSELSIKIASVMDLNKESETYCFTEHKRHMGMFNGILTGQCVEITQPTKEYNTASDLYLNRDPGYITVLAQEADNPDNGIFTLTYEYSEPVQFDDELFRGKPVFRKAGDMQLGGKYTTSQGTFLVKKIEKVKPSPEVSLCSLAAIVEPNVVDDNQYEKTAYYALYVIDRCIDIATYPLPHIKYTSMMRRNAGVGLSGIAYSLAKKGYKYSSQEGRDECHRIAERHSYFLIKAALKLGQEKGNAPWMHKTLWPQGWLPIDTYKKTIDKIVTVDLQYDWESLREQIIANGGIRFSSLIAHMPLESSSKSSGSPNSLYPLRDLAISKTDGISKIDWAATDSDLLKDNYEFAWDIHESDLLKIYGIFQKFADQAISADLYKDRRGDKLMYSEKRLMEEYATMVKYGIKTRYYQNSLINEKENQSTESDKADCAGGACKM